MVIGGVVLGAACGGDNAAGPDAPPAVELSVFHFDVVRLPHVLSVAVTDTLNPCAQAGFAEPGMCDADGDSGCAPLPGLTGMRLEAGGQVVLTDRTDFSLNGLSYPLPDVGVAPLVLYIEAIDGREVAIPLARATDPIPIPTIDDVVVAGQQITITWHATPVATSAVVAALGALGGPRCHVLGTDPVTFPWRFTGDYWQVYVDAFGPPVTVATAFGEAHVWTGAGAGLQHGTWPARPRTAVGAIQLRAAGADR
jgi:hypothetical protein